MWSCSEEVREFVSIQCRESGLENWLLTEGVTPDVAINTIADKVRDNFMYAATLFDDLRDNCSETNHQASQALEQLPKQLVGYYGTHSKKYLEINMANFGGKFVGSWLL